jgi:small subunit ribosomal protein S8
MTLNDNLANVLSNILNHEKLGKSEITIRQSSKLIKETMSILNKNKYVGAYTSAKDNRGEILKLSLIGRVNECGVIKPRFSVKRNGFEKFEKRFLPAKDFGILVVSTSKGLMTHLEAREKGLGGKLIAYCY